MAALILLHDMLGKEPYVPKQLTITHQGTVSISEENPPINTTTVREIKPLPENVEAKIRKRIQSLKRDKK